jgi:hypothetical protein
VVASALIMAEQKGGAGAPIPLWISNSLESWSVQFEGP